MRLMFTGPEYLRAVGESRTAEAGMLEREV